MLTLMRPVHVQAQLTYLLLPHCLILPERMIHVIIRYAAPSETVVAVY